MLPSPRASRHPTEWRLTFRKGLGSPLEHAIVLHLADLIEKGFHESEEGTEVSALAKPFLVSLHGVPLDPNREVVWLLDALADLVAETVRRGVEVVCRVLVRGDEWLMPFRRHFVTNVLENHDRGLRSSDQACASRRRHKK